jgi:hypothetical protein
MLVLIGVVFVLTAFVYGIMVTRDTAAFDMSARASVSREDVLIEWMRQYGNLAVGVELSLLAICTFGAIGTDEYWQRRAAAQRKVD